MISTESRDPPLRIALFGPMQVWVQGRPLPHLRSRKALWLLALLTLRHGRPIEREWLAGTLWPEMDQNGAFANLRPILSDLRSALGSESTRLQSPNRHTLLWDLTDAEVDLVAFDAAMARKELSVLEQAVALHHRPLLEGCLEEWAPQERRIREEQCLQGLQRLGDHALAEGDTTAAIAYYQRAVSIDAWCETAQRGWMEALAQSGDRNASLRVYRDFLHVLRRDPTADPDPLTSALYARLRAETRQNISKTAEVPLREAVPPPVSGYLPYPLTDMVGREDDRIEVAAALRRSRLVTLTGPGGIGKTRLATDIARDIAGEYADGVWLIALEALSDGGLVAAQLASMLKITEEAGRPFLQSVIEHLRSRQLLLVLDNCEHLLEATVQVVGPLLQACPAVRILATSRQALGIMGELLWTVPSLTVPDPNHLPLAHATLLRVLIGYESVQLFVERAQAAQQTFALTGTNAHTIARICAQLEGMPLALELAASRVKAMTVEQLELRLQNHLGLLSEGSRSAMSRQQTLRATVEWSHVLLSAPEQTLFRRLAVFTGGWSLEAAEAIGADAEIHSPQVLDLLISLVSKSLVQFEQVEDDALGRYRFLEIVRQYAAEQLQTSGETEQIQARYRDWFLAWAEELEPLLKGAERETHLRRLKADYANLRAILAAEGSEERIAALRLAGALGRFWNLRGYYQEGRSSLERLLVCPEVQAKNRLRAKALYWAGALANHQSDYAQAQKFFAESLEIRREQADEPGIAEVLNTLGNTAYMQSDFPQARKLYTESLRLRREFGDKTTVADSLHNLAKTVRQQGDSDQARLLFTESLGIRRELGDRRGAAETQNNLAYMARREGDYVLARTLYEETARVFEELEERQGKAWVLSGLGAIALEQGDFPAAHTFYAEACKLFAELGARRGIASSLDGRGHAAFHLGEYAEARKFHMEALTLLREMGDLDGTIDALSGIGEVLFAQQQSRQAVHLWAVAEGLGASLGMSRSAHEAEQNLQRKETVCAQIGKEVFEAAWAEGCLLSWEQTVDALLQEE